MPTSEIRVRCHRFKTLMRKTGSETISEENLPCVGGSIKK